MVRTFILHSKTPQKIMMSIILNLEIMTVLKKAMKHILSLILALAQTMEHILNLFLDKAKKYILSPVQTEIKTKSQIMI